jgi:hypothetical protein
MKNRIYMVSDTGALWLENNDPKDIMEACQRIGYIIATRKEYKAKRLQQQKEERKNEEKEEK